MARTSAVNSATSQFFINLEDNNFLDYGERDYGYAVFGEVISGFEFVDEIAKSQTTTKNGMQNWPRNDVYIRGTKIKKN
jgi:peptidyl-prolyl cis-trans isomerase A (cyclophilin A)